MPRKINLQKVYLDKVKPMLSSAEQKAMEKALAEVGYAPR